MDTLAYQPGPRERSSYRLQGAAMIGAGVGKAHEFALALAQGAPGNARWITRPGQVAFSCGANPRDSPQPFAFTFARNEVEQLRGTLLVQDTGYYEVAFPFDYSNGARVGRHTSAPIRPCAER